MPSLPKQDPTQQKLEKAVTKMPKPKELEAPELNQDQIPAPGSGPFGTSLIGAGSLPSAPTITSNVTGDRTPAPLLTTTTDIAKQTTQQQKEPMKVAFKEPAKLLPRLWGRLTGRSAREAEFALHRAHQKYLDSLAQSAASDFRHTTPGIKPSQEALDAYLRGMGKLRSIQSGAHIGSVPISGDVQRILNRTQQTQDIAKLLGLTGLGTGAYLLGRSHGEPETAKEGRYKLSRRMTFRDFNISIETDKGELRHWYDPHNKEKGTTKMTHPYGYIRRTKGVDGDHVDVYVGPNEQAKNVYIVHQMKAPEFKAYDEDKCMLGFDSAEAAKAAYLKNFNDNRFFGSMTTMPYDDFKKKVLKSFDLKRPHKIAEAIMNPHLKTAYLTGADMAKTAFEKEAFTLIETLIAAGLLGAGAARGARRQLERAKEEGASEGGRAGAGIGGMLGGVGGMGGGFAGGTTLSNLLRRAPLPKTLRSLAQLAAIGGGTYGGYRAGQALGGRAGQAVGELGGDDVEYLRPRARQALQEKESAAPPTAPTAVPIAAQPDVLGGLLDTAESGLSSAYQAGKAGLGKAYSVGESGLDRLLAALKKRQPAKTPEQKKEASAALLKALLLAGGLGGAGYGLHQLTGSQTAENVSGERTRRGLEAAGLLGKEGQAMPAGEPMMPPEQAAADTAMPPEAAGAAPALGDPNFWAGGGAPGSAAAAAAGAQSAEEVIGLLPAGTFQGMNVRITPDGQKSTGLKVTPEAIDAPEALKAVFQAEPTARVEITTPETPASVTSFREQG